MSAKVGKQRSMKSKKTLLRDLEAPSVDDFEVMVDEVIRRLPEPIFIHTKDLMIRIVDFPDDETCETMELESPYDLLGLYHGVDLPSQSIQDVGRLPDIIYLYRRPILDYWCETGETLGDIVRHVLIHEIGHHFGFSDEQMEAIEGEDDEEEEEE